MTATSTRQSSSPRRTDRRDTGRSSRVDRVHLRRELRPLRTDHVRRTLGRYTDGHGRVREVIARQGSAGSVLVVDRDAETLGDRRLVAHLAADEPQENAVVVCERYLRDASVGRCRALSAEDASTVPFAEDEESDAPDPEVRTVGEPLQTHGCAYRLQLVQTGMSIPELRWCLLEPECTACEPRLRSVRDVVAAMESYEPARTLTRRALALQGADPSVSTTVLRVELERVLESPIILNRGLRIAVLAAIEREGLSMSEIAIRCERSKRDCKGNLSGETSWLARRLGLLAEGGHSAPTPWVHSDVLALIARRGLGISPREVEL